MVREPGPGPQFADFEWEPRWHANPDAICASLHEDGDTVSLVFCAGIIRMAQEDRKHVVNQLRVAALLLEGGGQRPSTEHAVMVGVDDDDNAPTALAIFDDDLASAEELAQHAPESWIARRRVWRGRWERNPDADPYPFSGNSGEKSK